MAAVSEEVEPRAPAWARRRAPAETTVAPVKVLAAERVATPRPSLVRPAEPRETAPASTRSPAPPSVRAWLAEDSDPPSVSVPASLPKREAPVRTIAPPRVFVPERLRRTPAPRPLPATTRGSLLVMSPKTRRAAPAETTVWPTALPRPAELPRLIAPAKTLVTPV